MLIDFITVFSAFCRVAYIISKFETKTEIVIARCSI